MRSTHLHTYLLLMASQFCVSPAFSSLKIQVTPPQPVLLEIKFSHCMREQKLSFHVLWLIILPTCILRVTNHYVTTLAGVCVR